MKEMLEKLYELYEKNVNAPTRENTLTAISAHPKGNVIAQLVFERANSEVFLSAKNQLLPENEGDEYGPFDSLLETPDCKRILRLMATENYVIDLLKDEFQRRTDHEAESLSDIVRILADLEQIKEETFLPKATFKSESEFIKIGSEWILSKADVHDENARSEQDDEEFIRSFTTMNVYQISRSNDIHLKRLDLPFSGFFMSYFFFEPFLITFEKSNFRVYNLLEPSAPPMNIKRDGEIIGRMTFMNNLLTGPMYSSDNRFNGEFPDNVLFPVIWKDVKAMSVRIDCVRIGSSAMETVWKKEVHDPKIADEYYIPSVYLLDQDNYVLLCDDHVSHIYLPKRKIIRYIDYYEYTQKSQMPSFAMFGDRLGMMYSEELGWPYGKLYHFGLFTDKTDHNFEVLCFFYAGEQDTVEIGKGEIRHASVTQIVKTIKFNHLFKYLNDKDVKKEFSSTEINGVTVTKPFIQIEEFSAAETGIFKLKDRSKIGRVIRKKIEIFI